jgi:hypothetical protein
MSVLSIAFTKDREIMQGTASLRKSGYTKIYEVYVEDGTFKMVGETIILGTAKSVGTVIFNREGKIVQIETYAIEEDGRILNYTLEDK